MHRSQGSITGSQKSIFSESVGFRIDESKNHPKSLAVSVAPSVAVSESSKTMRLNRRNQPKEQKEKKPYKFDISNFPVSSSQKNLRIKEPIKANHSLLHPCVYKVKIEPESCFM